MSSKKIASVAGFNPVTGSVRMLFQDEGNRSAEVFELDIEVFGDSKEVNVESGDDLLMFLKESLTLNSFVMAYANPQKITIGFVAVGSSGVPKRAELPLLRLKNCKELADFMALDDAIDKALKEMKPEADAIPLDSDQMFL